ncbi:MAG: CRISPR-associated protein Cas4 [Thermoprotei archaeon]
MSELGYLTATDIKHYGYCEAIIYITHILGIQENPTEYMEYGREIEKEKYIAPVIAKYKPTKILKKPQIISKEYKLSGSPDYILITKHDEYIPLEIKWTEPTKEGKAKKDHILQITAYALLLEQKTRKTIKKGILFYLKPEGKLIEINITYDLKLHLIKILKRIKEIVEGKREPKPSFEKCESCNYKQYCPFRPITPHPHT